MSKYKALIEKIRADLEVVDIDKISEEDSRRLLESCFIDIARSCESLYTVVCNDDECGDGLFFSAEGAERYARRVFKDDGVDGVFPLEIFLD